MLGVFSFLRYIQRKLFPFVNSTCVTHHMPFNADRLVYNNACRDKTADYQ